MAEEKLRRIIENYGINHQLKKFNEEVFDEKVFEKFLKKFYDCDIINLFQ